MPLERLFVPGRKRYVSREEAENTRELSKLNKQLLNTAIDRSRKPIELVDARGGRSDASASIEAGQLALGVDGGTYHCSGRDCAHPRGRGLQRLSEHGDMRSRG